MRYFTKHCEPPVQMSFVCDETGATYCQTSLDGCHERAERISAMLNGDQLGKAVEVLNELDALLDLNASEENIDSVCELLCVASAGIDRQTIAAVLSKVRNVLDRQQ